MKIHGIPELPPGYRLLYEGENINDKCLYCSTDDTEWTKCDNWIWPKAFLLYCCPEDTVESYLDGHRASGLKVGDRVRVTRKALDREGGWDNDWTSDMLDGAILTIESDNKERGFRMGEDTFCYPYFVLEKVSPAGDLAAKFAVEPPKLAPGRNIHGLTEDQVGVKDGWRLITEEEFDSLALGWKIEAWGTIECPDSWVANFPYPNLTRLDYRTKEPLPSAKKEVPLGPEDWDGIWWVRGIGADYYGLTTAFRKGSGGIHYVRVGGQWLDGTDLQHNYERSQDGKNWQPCHKLA